MIYELITLGAIMHKIIENNQNRRDTLDPDKSLCDIRIPDTYLRIRRIFELALIIIAMPAILPVFGIIYIALLLGQRSNPIFRQKRPGKDQQPFIIYKFRSMRPLSKIGHKYHFDRERVHSLGKFLRKTRLDELPQLINVLKGDMSLIGPRPEPMAYYLDCVRNIPYFECRYIIRPGISGWAQVNYEHTDDVEHAREKLKFDFYYLNNISPALDLKIFFLTFWVMLMARGR